MTEWQTVPLGQIAEVYDGPHATPKKADSGPVFLGISNLTRGRLDLTSVRRLSEADFARWTRRIKPRPGDIVFSYETRLGEAARIPEGLRCCLGRRMGLLRVRDEASVDERFLLYAYLGPIFQETLRSRTIHGSTVDRIPLIEMPRFPIEIPENIRDQQAIASILGSLDDKIELNRQMSDTLVEIATALFRSWFVDFDPVWAKTEGRYPGVPDHVAKLFPDSFESSEMGEVPAGWRISRVGDEFELIMGQSPPGYTYNTDGQGLPFYQGSRDFGSRFPSRRVFCTAPTRIAEPNDVLVSVRAPVGDTNVAMEKCAIGRGVAAIRHDRQSFALYSVLGLRRFFGSFDSDGTVFAAIGKASLSDLPVVSPPNELADVFERHIGVLDRRIAEATMESDLLAVARDTLLPKLMSGELSIRNAERFVEQVV